jgi:hypothetical protein
MEGPQFRTAAAFLANGHPWCFDACQPGLCGGTKWSEKLVLFSDMRNDTRDLNLEAPQVASGVHNGSRNTETVQAELHDVQVFVCGVDGADKSVFYWQALQQFWREYFTKAGASMTSFSVLRGLPQR